MRSPIGVPGPTLVSRSFISCVIISHSCSATGVAKPRPCIPTDRKSGPVGLTQGGSFSEYTILQFWQIFAPAPPVRRLRREHGIAQYDSSGTTMLREVEMTIRRLLVSLSPETIELMDRMRLAHHLSRDEFIEEAVGVFLERLVEQGQAARDAEAYVQGYASFPETPEEIQAADRLGASVLAMEPWE